MKRFLSLLFAALMLFSLTALAEGHDPFKTDATDATGATGATDPTGATDAAGATANDVGAYRVIVLDADGNPVEGAVVQLCDEFTCSLQKTKADGVATFQVENQKVYEVHVAKVPEGYASSDETYLTLDIFSDVNVTVSRAE